MRNPLGCRLSSNFISEVTPPEIVAQERSAQAEEFSALEESLAELLPQPSQAGPQTKAATTRGIKTPLGCRLSEDSPFEAPVAGFNRHQKLMSPATRELVLKARQTEIQAFAEDRGYDPGMISAIAEVAMRTGRVPDMRQYGFAGDDAKAIKHYIAGEILNLAIEDIEQMERDLAEEWSEASRDAAAKARGKTRKPRGPHQMVRGVKKVRAPNLSRTGHKHPNPQLGTKHYKAATVGAGLAKMKERPGMRRGGKGTARTIKRAVSHSQKARAASSYREDAHGSYGEFLAEMASPEAVQKFHGLLQKNFVKIKERLANPGELAKYVVRLARSAGLKPLDAIGPAMTYVMQHAKQGKLKKQVVGHVGEEIAAAVLREEINAYDMAKHLALLVFKEHKGKFPSSSVLRLSALAGAFAQKNGKVIEHQIAKGTFNSKKFVSAFTKFVKNSVKSEDEDLDEAKKRKLHPSMHKHTNAPHFKAHSGDPKDEKPPFHKGKGLKAESATTYGEYLAGRR